MKVAGIQLSISVGKKESNLAKAIAGIRKAVENGADLICLPEFFSTGNFTDEIRDQYFTLSEEETGNTVNTMAALAKELKAGIIVPFFEKDSSIKGKYYNSAVLLNRKGEITGKYRKQFVPTGKYFERYYFDIGNCATPVFSFEGIKLGILICFDRHFFELSRILCLKGADIIFVPASSFKRPGIDNLWRAEIITLAATNALFVFGVNTTGLNDNIEQFGKSIIADPFGNILSELEEEEGIILADLDLEKVTKARISNPVIRNYRIENLRELINLYVSDQNMNNEQ